MKVLSFLIKPASSTCNLKCKYCFYADVSEHRQIKSNGIMHNDTMKSLIDKAFSALDEDGEVTFAFQGGEPTVAGLDYFQKFCTYVDVKIKKSQKVHYAIQTNAYNINEEWCTFFYQYNFLVGVSLDGYKENHDYFRLTTGNKATYNIVVKALQLLRKYKVNVNVLTVLSKQLAKHPQKLYAFYKKADIQYIQLIPCLAGFDELDDPFALTPEIFAEFYKSFYDLWVKELQSGTYRSVSLFDNIIPMFEDIPPHQCGLLGYCSLQFVVESDGSVYPCDFYVLDKYNGGNIKEMDIIDIAKSETMQVFLKEDKNMSTLCNTCPFISICHGNCKRMNSLYFHDEYCGYQDFLKHAYPSMKILAKQLCK